MQPDVANVWPKRILIIISTCKWDGTSDLAIMIHDFFMMVGEVIPLSEMHVRL